jgi:MOSC domain-containing protein YiiM
MKLNLVVDALAVRDKAAAVPQQGRNLLELSLEGVVGDIHSGFTRPADGRDVGITRGTPVRNWRQWSAVSAEEMRAIADRMGLDSIDPCLLSANITFSGLLNFTALPRGTELRFESGAILTVEDENAPCTGPGKEIARLHPEKKAHEFVQAAMHLRGLVGVVYRAGVVKVGDRAEVRLYEPRPYTVVGAQIAT